MATLSTVIALGAVSAMGIYWSSVFRRTVHATAVTYATVIGLTLVTSIIFLIGASMHRPDSWEKIPLSVKAPLFLNPVFFLTMGFAPIGQLYPEWLTSLGIFLFLTLAAILLTLRNLRRSGENV
jgi:hypothetical protein